MSENPATVIEQRVRRKARIVRGILFTAALWLILYGAICLEQAVSWSDPLQGLMNGAMLGWLFAAFSLVVMIPLGLLCIGIVHLTPWRRHRRWFYLLPGVAILIASLVPTMLDRINPGRRFERVTGVPLPASARQLQAEFSGGMFVDMTAIYSFECGAADTAMLIQSLGLTKEESAETHIIGGHGGGFSGAARGWTEPERWTGKVRHTDFFELHTDQSKTRVHIVMGDI